MDCSVTETKTKIVIQILTVSSGYRLLSSYSLDASGMEVREITIRIYTHTALDFKTTKLNLEVIRGNGIFQKNYLMRNKKTMSPPPTS